MKPLTLSITAGESLVAKKNIVKYKIIRPYEFLKIFE